MINGIIGKEFNEKDYIKLNFKISFSVFKKLMKSKYIHKNYTIKELIEDEL